jgi:hypothetical protein
MPSLYWDIHWRFQHHLLDRDIRQACEQAILARLLQSKRSFVANDLGYLLEGLSVTIQNRPVEFSATLTFLDPPSGCKVDNWTNIYARDPDEGGRSGTDDLSPVDELEKFIMRKVVFDPVRPESHYLELYNSLIGTEKEIVLAEAASLLTSMDRMQEWGMRHYNHLPPVLRIAANKPPVIVFGGDPGTGKTALATSLGAPLSRLLKEKVHFRQMSLAIRGMGFQGRASSMVTAFFKYAKEEYIKLREPLLLFFDEAESIVGSREQTSDDSGAWEDVAIVNAVINGIDDLHKGAYARVIVIFATNIVGRMDAALLRRCYYHRFERPDAQVRRALFNSSLQGLGLDNAALELLVEATQPRETNGNEIAFTHSDIVELIIVRAVGIAIQSDKPVTIDLLLDCCKKAVPTRLLTR